MYKLGGVGSDELGANTVEDYRNFSNPTTSFHLYIILVYVYNQRICILYFNICANSVEDYSEFLKYASFL